MRGRGFSYVHYKHSESYVAMGMEVAVERASGRIKVERVACAHDCGQIINPDGVRAQVEGSILQTLSRALMEEVKFDRSRVTSVDWSSYPIMRFSEVPKLDIELIDRPTQPLGTHLYTALGFKEDGTNLRWNLVTMPTSPVVERGSRKAARRDREAAAVEAATTAAVEAGECTADAGGSLSTREAAVAIARRLE